MQCIFKSPISTCY